MAIIKIMWRLLGKVAIAFAFAVVFYAFFYIHLNQTRSKAASPPAEIFLGHFTETIKTGHFSLRNCPDVGRIFATNLKLGKSTMGDGKSFPSEKERAFFIETSGKLSLSYRQSCALESFAFHNRNKWIELLIVVNNKTELKAGSSNLIRRLTCHYDNINVNYIHVENLINGTLLENWYYYSTWQTSPYKKAHLSDGLRLLLLFKYGGYYFDLDIIHIRPVGDSLRNFFTLQDQYQVCNAALHSDKQHNIIEISLQGFTQDYRADVWDHNGPVLLTRAFKKWCEKNIKEKEDHVECKGFRAYAPSLFYPVDFEELDLLFSNNVKQRNYFGSEVTGVHTWNKLSYKRTVFKHSHQLYNSLARENCPVTFQHSPMMF